MVVRSGELMPHNWLITGDDWHGDLVEISLDGPALAAAREITGDPGDASWRRTPISRDDALRLVGMLAWDARWGPHPVRMVDDIGRAWHIESQRLHVLR